IGSQTQPGEPLGGDAAGKAKATDETDQEGPQPPVSGPPEMVGGFIARDGAGATPADVSQTPPGDATAGTLVTREGLSAGGDVLVPDSSPGPHIRILDAVTGEVLFDDASRRDGAGAQVESAPGDPQNLADRSRRDATGAIEQVAA